MDNILISVGGAFMLVMWGMWQSFKRVRQMEAQIPRDTVGNDTIDSKLQSQRDSLQQEFGVIKVQLENQIRTLSDKNAEQAVKISNLETNDRAKELKINSLNERIVNLTDSLENEKQARIEAEKRATEAEKAKSDLAVQADKDKIELQTEIKVLGARVEILTKIIENPAPIRFVIDASMLVSENGKNPPVENPEKGVN